MIAETDFVQLLALLTLCLLIVGFVNLYGQLRLKRRINRLELEFAKSRLPLAITENEAEPNLSGRFKFRAVVSFPGYIRIEGVDHAMQVENISRTGALIRCDVQSLHLDAIYPVAIELPDGHKVTTSVKIIRILSQYQGFGCAFHNISLGDVRAITRYVSSEAEKDLLE